MRMVLILELKKLLVLVLVLYFHLGTSVLGDHVVLLSVEKDISGRIVPVNNKLPRTTF
jgi:hypothetical protein